MTELSYAQYGHLIIWPTRATPLSAIFQRRTEKSILTQLPTVHGQPLPLLH